MKFPLSDSLPVDVIVIILVILAGLFQKKYLEGITKFSDAWKTLIVSAVFTFAYAILVLIAGDYNKTLPLKWFFSYVSATSLYELFLKRFMKKFFPEDAAKLIILFAFLLPLTSCSTVKHDNIIYSTAAYVVPAAESADNKFVELENAIPVPDTITFSQEQLEATESIKRLGAFVVSILIASLATIFGGILIVYKILQLKNLKK